MAEDLKEKVIKDKKEVNISQTPLFLKYLHSLVNRPRIKITQYDNNKDDLIITLQEEYNKIDKESSDYISLSFLIENISVIGYCKCGEIFCRTVSVKSKKPFPQNSDNFGMVEYSIGEYIHLNEKNYPYEVEMVSFDDGIISKENDYLYEMIELFSDKL